MIKGTTGDPKTDSILRDLDAQIEALKEKLQAVSGSAPSNTQGSEGSIRIVNMGNDLYVVAVKSKDGWLVSDTTTFTFKTKLD